MGVVAFIINNHGDLRMCLPPIPRIASAPSSTTMAYSPPPTGPSYPFGLQNAAGMYQWTSEHLHVQISRKMRICLDMSNQLFPASDEEEDEPEAKAPTRWAPGARICSNLTHHHQPAPASQLVAMVCNNCFVGHSPEDCFLDESIFCCSANTADLISNYDHENNGDDATSVPDDTNKKTLARPSPEYREVETNCEPEPPTEAGDSQQTTDEASDEYVPQPIFLHQVMMIEHIDGTIDPNEPVVPKTTIAPSTMMGSAAPQSHVITTPTPREPFITPQQPNSKEASDSEQQNFFTPGAIAFSNDPATGLMED